MLFALSYILGWLESPGGTSCRLTKRTNHVNGWSFLLCLHLVQGSRFRVQGSRSGFAAFFIGRCSKVVFKSQVTSHNNDTSRPLETEVPQRDFRVWPNPKRRLACPLRRLPVRPNGPRRRRRMDPRSGVKNYVRLPVSLKRHPDRSGGILPADR